MLKTSLALMALLVLSGCGKKARDGQRVVEKSYQPSVAQLLQTTMRDLKKAVTANDFKKTKDILSRDSQLNLNYVYEDGETLLTTSVRQDSTLIIDLLIDRGANIEKANVNGETPLIVASKFGRMDSIKRFLMLKVPLNEKDVEGNTALHWAIKKKFEPAALLLINNGANIYITNNENKSPMNLASQMGTHQVEDLLKSWMQVDYGTPDAATFISILTLGDVKALSPLLMKFPLIVSQYRTVNPLVLVLQVKDHNTALLMTNILLNHEVEIDGPLHAPTTPLIESIKMKDTSFFELFLREGANPNLTDSEGKSALIHAIEKNLPGAVNLLLKYNAETKYTVVLNGRTKSFSACQTARDTRKNLSKNEELTLNEEVKEKLSCGLRGLF